MLPDYMSNKPHILTL